MAIEQVGWQIKKGGGCVILLTDFSDVVAQGMTGFAEAVETAFKIPARLTKKRFLENSNNVALWWNLCRARISELDYWDHFVSSPLYRRAANESNGNEVTAVGLCEVFRKNTRIPIPGTFELYSKIKSHPAGAHRSEKTGEIEFSSIRTLGIPEIVVVSDQIAELLPELKKSHEDFFLLVDQEFWSCNMGCIKADPAFFDIVLKALLVDPDNIVYVDDNSDNIAAAQKHGIFNTIQFIDADDLQNRLETEYQFQFFGEDEV